MQIENLDQTTILIEIARLRTRIDAALNVQQLRTGKKKLRPSTESILEATKSEDSIDLIYSTADLVDPYMKALLEAYTQISVNFISRYSCPADIQDGLKLSFIRGLPFNEELFVRNREVITNEEYRNRLSTNREELQTLVDAYLTKNGTAILAAIAKTLEDILENIQLDLH